MDYVLIRTVKGTHFTFQNFTVFTIHPVSAVQIPWGRVSTSVLPTKIAEGFRIYMMSAFRAGRGTILKSIAKVIIVIGRPFMGNYSSTASVAFC